MSYEDAINTKTENENNIILNKNEKVPCTFSSSKIPKLLNTAGALFIFGWRKKKSSILSKVLLFNIIIYLVFKLFL